MKSLKPYPLDPAILAALQAKVKTVADPADLVLDLRKAGLDKVTSMKFIAEFYEMRLGKAKDIVHLSPVWDDRYEADEAFHDSAERALNIIIAQERDAA